MSGNVKIIKNNVKDVLDAVRGDRLARAVIAGGLIIEGAVKISMSALAKTGRIYGTHQASAPGEPPAVEFSNLVNSISTELASVTQTEAWANVGTNVEYAEPLEFGTSRMAARPFMRPAYDDNENLVKETIRRTVKEDIEGAASA